MGGIFCADVIGVIDLRLIIFKVAEEIGYFLLGWLIGTEGIWGIVVVIL